MALAPRRSDYEQPRGDLFLTERTMSDVSVGRRARLGKRLVRRYVSHTFFQMLRTTLKP
jgi:hypothetical protein